MNWEISTLLGIFIVWQLIYFLLFKKQIDEIKIQNHISQEVNKSLLIGNLVGNYIKNPESISYENSQESLKEKNLELTLVKKAASKKFSEERRAKISEGIKKNWEKRRLQAQKEPASIPETKQEPVETGLA